MAGKPYVVISDVSMMETTVNKSRFIGVSFPVTTVEEVKQNLMMLKKSNKDAKHIAYAYLLGEDFSVARNSDDGEPAGSAGAPIYQAIRDKKITNVLVAVVRYFGGVELGKSRLTRVYYSTAEQSLANAKKIKMVNCAIYEMKISYGDFGSLGKVLNEKGFLVLDKNFDESMPKIRCAIPIDMAETFVESIRMKFKETAQIIRVGTQYHQFAM